MNRKQDRHVAGDVDTQKAGDINGVSEPMNKIANG